MKNGSLAEQRALALAATQTNTQAAPQVELQVEPVESIEPAKAVLTSISEPNPKRDITPSITITPEQPTSVPKKSCLYCKLDMIADLSTRFALVLFVLAAAYFLAVKK